MPLLTLGGVPPDEVPYWINAANAVLVPSQDEGFGLSVIEALGVRRAGVRDAGRDPPGRAARDRGRVLRAVGPRRLARGAATARSTRPIRASTGGRAPSCSPPTGWPRASSPRGARSPHLAALVRVDGNIDRILEIRVALERAPFLIA